MARTAARRVFRLTRAARADCLFPSMYEFPLTGAQKTFLRGLGQTMEPSLKVGKAGLTPEFFRELQRHLNASELVKLRFLGADRDERAEMIARSFFSWALPMALERSSRLQLSAATTFCVASRLKGLPT